jgi:PAS domain-containing protein
MLMDERGDLFVRATKSVNSTVRALNERIQDTEAGRVMREKQTTILQGDHLPLHVATASKARTVAYVPLVTQGRAIGVLAVANQKSDRQLTRRETLVLSALGSYAAIAISNARLHQRIAAERNQLHTIINQSDSPILVVDHDLQLIVANQAARNILSLPHGSLDGRPLTELLHNAELLDFITQLPDTGLVRNTRVRLSTGRVYSATLTPIRDIGRSIVMQEVTGKLPA